MEAVIRAFEGVTTILIMIMVGFVLAKRGWFSEESTKMIARLVTNITLPPFMMTSILGSFDRERLLTLSHGLAVPIISMAIGYFAGHLAAKALKVQRGRIGMFSTMFYLSNTIFIGLPLNLALFGEEAVPYVMLYYMANTTYFWVIGAHDIALDGVKGEVPPIISLKTLKLIVSPPLLGFILGVIFLLLGWTLPNPVMRSFKYLGSMTTPLAMLFVGIAISRAKWADIHWEKDIVLAVIARFTLAPAMVMILLPFFDLPKVMREVFIMMSVMPAMTNGSILSEYYGADYKYAAVLIVITTVLALVTTPLYMWLATTYF